MRIISDLKLVAWAYKSGIHCIRDNKLGPFFALMTVLYLLVFACTIYLTWLGMSNIMDLLANIEMIKRLTAWMTKFSWLVTIVKIGTYLSSFLLITSIYKYVFLALASPLFSILSEKIDAIITGTQQPFTLLQFIKDTWRGILISLLHLIKQLIYTIPLFLLSLIPVVGIFFSIFLILLDSYYIGFSMLDYNCERNRLSISSSIMWVKKRKYMAIGIGLIMYLSLLIPLIGVIIIAPLSAIAATYLYHQQNNSPS